MVHDEIAKVSKMVKTKKEALTPRRRTSVGKAGALGKVTKVLSRPVSGTAPCVAPVCNIKVVVRVRPPNVREQQENYQNVVKVVDDQMLIFDPKEADQPFFYHGVQQKTRDLNKRAKKDVSFVFDKVFHNASTNLEVFMNSTKSLINTLMDGYNCSVFAYGATGAGKTFTMLGNPDSPGITYLTMQDLFKRKEELMPEREFELMVTYIEVYNELVKDLLNPGPPLNLREDAKYGVMIPGVKGHIIHSADDLFSLLEQGNRRRTQHPTDANAESSRSHAVFQVYLQMTMKCSREVRRAKLSMIDLAGSERGSATGFVGARFKEGANINKSLLALGNCINSLADGQRHVPYRDSKLTRLLKDSLGGNCHTIMIANVSPSSMSFDDTYNTLKYATRAKKIKSNMKRNIVNVDMHIDQYIKLVDDLQTENNTLKSDNAKFKKEIEALTSKLSSSQVDVQMEQLLRERDELKAQNERLLGELASKQSSTDPVNAEIKLHLESLKEKANSYHAEMEALKSVNEELKNENAVIVRSSLGANVDAEVLGEFKKLVEERKELMEREFQVKSCELGMSLRRELKTETRNRLSNFYVYTPDKDDMRKRLNEQVERYQKKEKSTMLETEEVRKKLSLNDEKLTVLLEAHPELAEANTQAKLELDVLAHKHQAGLKQKEIEILLDDHKDKYSIIENTAKLLKRLFLAAGGKDDAAESIKREYEELIYAFNGKKSLKWQEQPDSGLSSLTNIQEMTEEKSRATKRKIETDSQVSLDSTFTCGGGGNSKLPSQNGPKTPVGGKSTVNTQMVAKGFKGPASKRLAHGVSPRRCSPRNRLSPLNKENTHYSRRPVVRPDTARTLINVKKTAAKTVLERPRFKM